MTAPVWAAIISALAAIGIGIANIVHNVHALRETKRHNTETLAETKKQNRATIAENRVLKKMDSIQKVLNEFYSPVNLYLQQTNSLHHLLVTGKPKEFRTLTYLMNPAQVYETPEGQISVILSEADKKLISEIIEIERKIEDILITKGGLVDDPALKSDYVPDPTITDVKIEVADLGLIALAVTHFQVLRLVFRKQLSGDVTHYEQFVFPRELPKRISENIDVLQKELKSLSETYEAGKDSPVPSSGS